MHDSARYPGLRREMPWISHAEPTPARRRIVSLDVGKAVDPAALCVLDWQESFVPHVKPEYTVSNLKRWSLGTPYVSLSAWLVKFFETPDPKRVDEPPPVLVVDETGVGAPVVEMIREALTKAGVAGGLIAITITAGGAVSQVVGQAGRWRVAKKVLASVLVTLFQSRRLNVAKLPETETLLKEAQAFSVKITPAGNETFESWRESDHDDLVLLHPAFLKTPSGTQVRRI
jgi:hypothetical protein